MTIVALFPAFFSAYFAFNRSPHYAFLNVFVPTLFLFPPYFAWKPPIIPDPNFYEAAIGPIMLVFLIRRLPGWHFSITDILVFLFAFVLSYSEYLNYNFKEAQNMMASMVLSVLFPYILTKSLIEPAGLRIEFAKRIVLILCVVSFFMVFENHFHSSYTIWQRVLGPIFDAGWFRNIRYRWGMARASGPFVHPINAGIIMAVAFQLQQWLYWNRAWPLQITWLPKLPLNIPQIITLIMAMGLFAPLSRGPWLAVILGIVTTYSLAQVIGLTRNVISRYLMIGVLIGGVAVGGLAMKEIFAQFASVSREEASSKDRETIAYRFQLYETYGAIILQKPIWGWGRLGWPVDKTQASIDNAFLLLALNHGIVASGCLITLFITMILKLFFHLMSKPAAKPAQATFSIVLLSILLSEMFSLSTVSLYGVNTTLLFIIFGWADGYLMSSNRYQFISDNVSTSSSPQPFRFRRTI
jgi:hypothetical protein